jgi:hypothetical protein
VACARVVAEDVVGRAVDTVGARICHVEHLEFHGAARDKAGGIDGRRAARQVIEKISRYGRRRRVLNADEVGYLRGKGGCVLQLNLDLCPGNGVRIGVEEGAGAYLVVP